MAFGGRTGLVRVGRRRAVRAVGGLAALGALLAGPRRGRAAASGDGEPAIVGTWVGEIAVGVRAGRPIRAMLFFFREGIMQIFEAPVVPTLAPDDPPDALDYQTLNSGGPWVSTGPDAYAAYLVGLNYDAAGTPTTTDVFRRSIRHDRATDTLTITSEVAARDPSGVETVRATNTITATRVALGP
jgi:hypothetical protein